MEEIRSSETSVNKISSRRHIPEDGILHVIWRLIKQHVMKVDEGVEVYLHPFLTSALHGCE
jgi:hypothetical protein